MEKKKKVIIITTAMRFQIRTLRKLQDGFLKNPEKILLARECNRIRNGILSAQRPVMPVAVRNLMAQAL